MGDGNSIVSAKYVYIHERESSASRALDTHHVEVRRSGAKTVAACLFAALLLASAFHVFLSKERSNALPLLGLPFGAFLMVKLWSKTVKKGLENSESVLILPSFGVQLETHYQSGRTIRRFVPIGKILKPVLQECVNPFTCYWCLSLILREEEELMLVFKDLRPPLKMLIPVWRALCAATDEGECSEECLPDG